MLIFFLILGEDDYKDYKYPTIGLFLNLKWISKRQIEISIENDKTKCDKIKLRQNKMHLNLFTEDFSWKARKKKVYNFYML